MLNYVKKNQLNYCLNLTNYEIRNITQKETILSNSTLNCDRLSSSTQCTIHTVHYFDPQSHQTMH